MKVFQKVLTAILSLALLIPAAGAATADSKKQMRGIWVSSVYNLDYPTKATVSTAALQS